MTHGLRGPGPITIPRRYSDGVAPTRGTTSIKFPSFFAFCPCLPPVLRPRRHVYTGPARGPRLRRFWSPDNRANGPYSNFPRLGLSFSRESIARIFGIGMLFWGGSLVFESLGLRWDLRSEGLMVEQHCQFFWLIIAGYGVGRRDFQGAEVYKVISIKVLEIEGPDR